MDVDKEGGEDEEDEDLIVENVDAFSARIEAFVRKEIEASMAGFSSSEVVKEEEEDEAEGSSSTPAAAPTKTFGKLKGRDGYKDGLVFAERKALLHEFNRKVFNKCQHCKA